MRYGPSVVFGVEWIMELDLSVVGQAFEPPSFEYDWQTCATYALGVGESALDYTWEGVESLKVVPSFAVVPTMPIVHKALHKIRADYQTLVHGAQTITLHSPIPPKGRLRNVGRVSEVQDKGKGAVVIIDTETFDAAGTPLFDTSWSIFCRGQGGFGGERGQSVPLPDPMADSPLVIDDDLHTLESQALLYRLSGDLNPLHVDPALATKVGFKAPILHGLCTYGFATCAVVRALCDGDPSRLKSFTARFSREVYPGDTLHVQALPSSQEGGYRLEVTVGERTVLSNGYIEIG